MTKPRGAVDHLELGPSSKEVGPDEQPRVLRPSVRRPSVLRPRVLRLRRKDVLSEVVDGQTLLLDLRSSSYLVVNESGTALLPALLAGADRESLAVALAAKFAISAQQAEADVDRFLVELEERDLLE